MLDDTAKDIRTILFRAALCAVLIVLFAVLGIQNSQGLDVTHTDLPITGLPQALQGLRIAEISDLHSSTYGPKQSELIDAVREFHPDVILLAGDITDGYRPQSEPCAELVKGLAPIAPVYRVRGNHEYYLDEQASAAFDARMAACGAVLLSNSAVALQKNGQGYLLAGMDDVTKYNDDPRRDKVGRQKFDMQVAQAYMTELEKDLPSGDFPLRIMLCHQPQYWQIWQQAGYQIALCGHLHGGLVRVPGVGGLVRLRPNVYFPEEDAGLYDKQGLLEYISRGLDDQARLRSIRINNKPELALFTVVCK